MTKLQWRALAVACWLATLACGIVFAALREDYTLYRDGSRITGTVIASDRPGSTHHRVRYVLRGQENTAWFPAADPLPIGASLELAAHNPGWDVIPADEVDGKAPSPLIVAGGVLALALGIYVWTIPSRSARRRARRTSPRDVLVDAAGRTRNASAAIGIFLVLAAIGFATVPSLDRESTRTEAIVIYALAVLAAGTGAFLLRNAWLLRDPSNNPILTLIEKRPRDIAWFYVERIAARAGQQALAVRIWKTDGKHVSLNGVEEDLAPLMEEIARCAPHARAGYSPQAEKAYKQSVAR